MYALLLPWVERDSPLTIKTVEFLPYHDALGRLDANERARLVGYTGMYMRSDSLSDALRQVRELRELAASPEHQLRSAVGNLYEPDHLEPLVVLAPDERELERARRAVDALMFATIVENGICYANSVTFRVHSYDLSRGGSALTEIRPRMHGRVVGGFTVDSHVIVRPDYAEQYHASGNQEFASALLKAQERPGGRYIVEALAALRLAMSDSPDVTPELQHTLFAKAATLVVWKRSLKSDRDKFLKRRIDELLTPFFRARRIRGLKRPLRGPSWIRKAWIAVRWSRNKFWHPTRGGSSRSRFSQQRLVLPIMIALRVAYALMVARLSEMRLLRVDSKLRQDVPAVAEWIAWLGPELEENLILPEYPPDPHDSAAMRDYARALTEWNSAASDANNWGRFRLEERLQAGIAKSVRERRKR